MEASNKHAYLIMAHNNFDLLSLLLQLIDDARNDIYIHIDKKVKDFDVKKYENMCTYSKVYFTSERIDVKWGGSSQVWTELVLYKEAIKHQYKYYHLISGVDLPLKSQNEIHDFFERHNHKEFIYYADKTTHWDYERLSRYHFPKKWNKKITAKLYGLQNKLKIDRIKKYNMEFKKGANWCSLTYEAVKYLVGKEKFIHQICRATSCADECYKQYLLCNSDFFKDRIFLNEKGKPDDLREIDWTNCVNSPHIYTMEDLEKLKNSNKIFARKFDEKVDSEIIRQIVLEIKSKG